MIKYVEGNAIDYVLDQPKDQRLDRILLHCCNAQGAYAAGIAKEIRKRVPLAYENYKSSGHKLGTISFDIDCHVVNMVAQERYGYQKGMRYISYKALIECLDKIRDVWGEMEYVIPYKMGSDR